MAKKINTYPLTGESSIPHSKTPYHLRRRHYLYTDTWDPETHYIQVLRNGVEYPKEHVSAYSSQVMLTGPQPAIGDTIQLQAIEIPEDTDGQGTTDATPSSVEDWKERNQDRN